MADRFYGVDIGAGNSTVVSEDSSTTSKSVEVVVDLAVVLTREKAILAVERIRDHLLNSNWPPA